MLTYSWNLYLHEHFFQLDPPQWHSFTQWKVPLWMKMCFYQYLFYMGWVCIMCDTLQILYVCFNVGRLEVSRELMKSSDLTWKDTATLILSSSTIKAFSCAGAMCYQSGINIKKGLLSAWPRSRAQTLLWLWLLIFFFFLFLTSGSRTGEKKHSRKLSKHRRGGPARGGKRCYSLWGAYVTSHLPLSLRNARIVFVNRAAMCVCSRGGSFWVAALAVSPLR